MDVFLVSAEAGHVSLVWSCGLGVKDGVQLILDALSNKSI